MGLFDKKFCDICGAQISLLGNRKLSDGNCCKDCAKKLSPFLTDRKGQTVIEIKEHLAYRENNKQMLQSFRPGMVLGNRTKIYIDQSAGTFVVSHANDYKADNADVIPLKDIIGVEVKIDEDRTELYETINGERRHYNPPRYSYSYDFDVIISLSSKWFNTIKFELSDQTPDSPYSELYRQYERQADDIKRALMPGYAGMQYNNQPQNGYYQQNNGYIQPQQNGFAPNAFNQPNMGPNSYQQTNNFGYQNNNQTSQYQNGYQQPVYNQNVQQGFAAQGMNQQMNNGGYVQQNNYNQMPDYNQNVPRVIRCDKCGFVINDGSVPRFCPACGDPITNADIM